MDVSIAFETTLLLVVPAAEPIVSRHRRQLDLAAQDGIPAHVTLIFPFMPLDVITSADHSTLEMMFADSQSFQIRGSQTAWLGESVLCIAVDDPEPTRQLITAVVQAFPCYPPYGGSVGVDEVIPHLTVGQDHDFLELQAAEREVRERLPFEQEIGHVELWAGPAVGNRTRAERWELVRSYQFGKAPG